jgi:hypothetical protein
MAVGRDVEGKLTLQMLVVATDVLVIASNAEAAIKRVGIRMALGGYCAYVGRME